MARIQLIAGAVAVAVSALSILATLLAVGEIEVQFRWREAEPTERLQRAGVGGVPKSPGAARGSRPADAQAPRTVRSPEPRSRGHGRRARREGRQHTERGQAPARIPVLSSFCGWLMMHPGCARTRRLGGGERAKRAGGQPPCSW